MPTAVRVARDGSMLGSAFRSPRYHVAVDGRDIAVSEQGFKLLATDVEARRILVECATSFRAFLDHWTFVPEGSPPMLLGPNLWSAQETYVLATEEHDSIYFLKARQLGETTIACAYDGWRMRFGPVNSRVSILSQTDENSKDFLRAVVYGLEHLPPTLALPCRALEHSASLAAGQGDARLIRSYPASNAIRSGSFGHVHLDEWAAMLDPRKVWQATEESIVPGGTCHVLTTGVGGGDFTGEEYRRAEEGNSRFHPLFIGALERDDRTEEWYEEKRRTTDVFTLRQELPLTVEDALSGGGEYRFSAEGVALCTRYPRGLQPCDPDRDYIISVDPGEKDGTAICVLDVTADRFSRSKRPVADVVHFRLLRPTTMLDAKTAIEQVARLYPRAPVCVEDNGIGKGLIPNLSVPAWRLHAHNTSALSKPRMISKLALAIQRGGVSWDPEQCPDLDREVRAYKDDDRNIRQDCVLAISIGLDNLGLAWRSREGGAQVWQI